MPAANRRAVREVVVRTVFEYEFRDVVGERKEILKKNIEELELKNYDEEFAKALLEAVFQNADKLKEWIVHLAPEWPFEKIARFDRAALQVGLAELSCLEDFDIPPKVTLNEYVEITKNYCDDSSRRFVNGVLSSAKKEMENEENEK